MLENAMRYIVIATALVGAALTGPAIAQPKKILCAPGCIYVELYPGGGFCQCEAK
jgi:hypothetical protein